MDKATFGNPRERLRSRVRLKGMNTPGPTIPPGPFRRVLLICSLAIAAGACTWLPAVGQFSATAAPDGGSLPEMSATLEPTAGPTAMPSVTPTPSATPTRTPDPSQPWGDYAPPQEPSAIEVPPPAPLIEMDPAVVNILVLGSDQRPYGGGYRTDVVMLVSLDPSKGTATLLSIPRDLYVYIPGWRVNRINTADPRGGPEMLANTIQYTFGVPVHYYARIDFSGFMRVIDTLGGVDVQVTGYLYDECGSTWYRYSPGNTYHMDGFTALCYVRMRKGSSDFDRLRRQQEVLEAIFRKSLTLNALSRFPQLYAQYRSAIQTDMSLTDAIPLIPLGRQLASDPSQIQRVRIDPSMATGWRVPASGASVLLPDHAKIQELMQQTFGS